MKRLTCRYIASFLAIALTTPVAAAAGELAAAQNLRPQAMDVGKISQILLTFDILIAGAEEAAQQDAAASRQLAHNGLHVAARPIGLSGHEAHILWQHVHMLHRNDRREALGLLQRSDVVTTEAHALLLEMVGNAPDFIAHAPPAGLSERQLAWVNLAPQMSALLRRTYRDADITGLNRSMGATLAGLQPSRADMLAHNRLLDATLGHRALPEEQVQVIVVPLMAKDTGATLMLGRNGALTLVGPTATKIERDTLVLHEMLHPRIASLIASNPALHQAIEDAACLRQALENGADPHAVSQVYDLWSDYLAESWVRGLSHQLTHSKEPNDGFALAAALGRLGGEQHNRAPLAVRATSALQQMVSQMCGHRA